MALTDERVHILLKSVGIDAESFRETLEWALSEHLVAVMASDIAADPGLFDRPTALRDFRDKLRSRTGRDWSTPDLEKLFSRVRKTRVAHYRRPVEYSDFLKLIWQVPWECAHCRRKPPEVALHIDHIMPASRGGSSKRENLQFLCREHNLVKSNSMEVSKWLQLT